MRGKAGLVAGKGRVFLLPTFLGIFVCTLILPVRADSIHLKIGDPSDAQTSAGEKDNYLLEKDYFALSFNITKGTLNWVTDHENSEQLT